ncbi:hypothetical protein U879_01640 [Defluviimonas sp. 20V17]|uniref:Response regulator receiver domain-containing protein n=1 Tax=Allgaiera indica TaxID=765699 RepID=A0AAN4UTK8_9RHOB|nr:response regulator [Allgaiera indica]KDB05397.1 hypothetical protein U879_01640 [Defluviimonas sp. 20V17]GHE04116.1 hypothetical protein GCM10008024_29930 [Allgaiera indica]SDX49550.1 Response regulator receiver domain-containing protein [Allgaiera indica]
MTTSARQTGSLNDDLVSGQALNVLILDDMETDRSRIRRLVRKAGLTCTFYEAEDLTSLREQIGRAEMHLVFIDYNLAIETGLDALKILAAHEYQAEALPIMVTSVDRCDVAVEAMRRGCADYLIKEQLSVDAVRKSISSAFERKILISAVAEAQSSRQEVRTAIRRFAATCGPEIREVLSTTLRRARAMRQDGSLNPALADSLLTLEENCQDIYGFLTSVADLLDDIGGARMPTAPQTGVL